MLTHSKLTSYQKALALAGDAERISAGWGRRHVIVEHFRRASEGIVLNIAEGNGRYSELDHRRFLELAAAATAKAAACLDLYERWIQPTQLETGEAKELLYRILAMLNGF